MFGDISAFIEAHFERAPLSGAASDGSTIVVTVFTLAAVLGTAIAMGGILRKVAQRQTERRSNALRQI